MFVSAKRFREMLEWNENEIYDLRLKLQSEKTISDRYRKSYTREIEGKNELQNTIKEMQSKEHAIKVLSDTLDTSGWDTIKLHYEIEFHIEWMKSNFISSG